jgi:hypothetical protein
MRVAVSRAPGAKRVVSPLEPVFDLVYVFALGLCCSCQRGVAPLGPGAASEPPVLRLEGPRAAAGVREYAATVGAPHP